MVVAFNSLNPVSVSARRLMAPTRFASDAQATGDQASFSASALTEARRAELVQKTTEEALTLFKANPTKAGLIQAAKAQFGDSLAIYDASQKGNEWVDKVCQHNGAKAFFQQSDSLAFGEDPTTNPTFNDEGGKLPPEYVNQVLPDLFRQKKMAIYLSSGASYTTLAHELFHAMQCKNGLPMGGQTKAVDDAAKAFRGQLDGPIGLLKRLAFMLFVRPFITAPKTDAANEKGDTPASALRADMRREMEVDQFMINHGKSCGIGFLGRLQHHMHYWLESRLQYVRSVGLEQAPAA